MTKKPKMIGTVNGYIQSKAWIKNKSFGFDGTTLGLVKSAIANGAVDGTKLKANFGGTIKDDARDFVIVAAAHDSRANGFWVR